MVSFWGFRMVIFSIWLTLGSLLLGISMKSLLNERWTYQKSITEFNTKILSELLTGGLTATVLQSYFIIKFINHNVPEGFVLSPTLYSLFIIGIIIFNFIIYPFIFSLIYPFFLSPILKDVQLKCK